VNGCAQQEAGFAVINVEHLGFVVTLLFTYGVQ
jgi:hypothetical protein